jgi:hypothetical protein
MNRSDAYGVLSDELRSMSHLGYDCLLSRIGQSTRRVLALGPEEVAVETHVRWHDAKKRAIRIEATAYGPSCWALERLEESIIIRPRS